MAIKMVREPSKTPNINNIDDIVPMRYAYGNQNGYVIGKGNEISNTVNGLNFTVNSGRLVLQGVECDIDATGVTITIDNIATKRYYTVYLEVNLGLNTATIKDEYDTATYPTIDAGDDLTENTTGVARLPLYQFTATSGIISEVNKVVKSIKYTPDIFVNNSKKVNGLEIKQDENGVLKIGDIIIPQKKVLWSGNTEINQDTTIQLSENLSSGDIVEIILEEGNRQMLGGAYYFRLASNYNFDGIISATSLNILKESEVIEGVSIIVWSIPTIAVDYTNHSLIKFKQGNMAWYSVTMEAGDNTPLPYTVKQISKIIQ